MSECISNCADGHSDPESPAGDDCGRGVLDHKPDRGNRFDKHWEDYEPRVEAAMAGSVFRPEHRKLDELKRPGDAGEEESRGEIDKEENGHVRLRMS